MAVHFEELWEQCETLQKDASLAVDVSHIVDELVIKLNLYKALDSKSEIPADERQKIQSRVLGDILLTFTCLSVKDNVNVYEALSIALQYRRLENYNKKVQS
jgi:hypothetical protein